MKERQPEFNFSFLRDRSGTTLEECNILIGGVHLINHLADHRMYKEASIQKEAEILGMNEDEVKIARQILNELERAGGESFRNLPEAQLLEGRRQAMGVIFEVWDEAMTRLNPNRGEKDKNAPTPDA